METKSYALDNLEYKCIPNKSGVYMIKNILNGNKYIGSTTCFKQRLKQHLSDLRNNKHHSPHLQAAWNKYGEKHFVFQILETCEPIKDTLLFIEQKYLDLKPEYNILINAYSCLGRRFSKEKTNEITSKRIENGWREKVQKPVLQYDLKGNFIKRFNSIKEASDEIGKGKRSAIIECCKGNFTRAGNYIWKYENDGKEITIRFPKYFKKIIQKDLNGNSISIFNSAAEAADNLIKFLSNKTRRTVMTAISMCARGISKTAYGYKWEYKN